MTNKQKRALAEKTLQDNDDLSDRFLANLTGLSAGLFKSVRAAKASSDGYHSTYRKGMDGKTYSVPVPPADPNVQTDACGIPIPEHAMTIFKRRGEIADMLAKIEAIRNKIEIADSLNDPLFKQCRTEGLLLDISKVYRHIRIALPEHVCPWCGGKGCSDCRTTGMVSPYVWGMAPEQLKKDLLKRA